MFTEARTGSGGRVGARDDLSQIHRRLQLGVEDAGVANEEARAELDAAGPGVDRERAAQPGNGLERRVAAEPGDVPVHDVPNVERAPRIRVRDVAGDGRDRGTRCLP